MKSFTKIQDEGYQIEKWQQPKTTRRYLHPPKSERMFTLWAEGKLIFGDVIDGSDVENKKNGHEYYHGLESCGIRLLYGSEHEQLDFQRAIHTLRDDAAPIHGLTYKIGDVEVYEEAFCDTKRKSSCYIQIRVTNCGNTNVTVPLRFLIRTGREVDLLEGGSDQYYEYAPHPSHWTERIPSIWKQSEERLTDGERVLYLLRNDGIWNTETGCLDYTLDIMPQQCEEIRFVLNKGESFVPDFEQAKADTAAFWQNELKRINKLPESIRCDVKKSLTIRHFTVQLLQCFAYSVGKNYLLFRQGGMQRIIWPGEVHVCFEALSKIGDFSDYLEPVLDTYFHVMQKDDGEIVNIGIYWAMTTGVCLFSLAKYCLNSDEAVGRRCFETYREHAFRAFEWIEKQRRSTVGNPALAGGLFPPLRSSDWPQCFQSWLTTDTRILDSMQAFAKAAEHFNDVRAGEAVCAYEDYFLSFKRALQPYVDEAMDKEELYIPLCPDGNDDKLVEDLYPLFHYGYLGMLGLLDDHDVDKVYRGLVNSNRAHGGLYGRMMIGTQGRRRMWYVSVPEFEWFFYYSKQGNREKMKEILDAQLKYAMTAEYAMQERFVEDSPYFSPWSPNASAMGRTILMMLAM